MAIGGSSDSGPYAPRCPVGDAWIALTTSMPRMTRPKTANPWPSGLRRPPKSIVGCSQMAIENDAVAVSGPFLAIDTAPSRCFSPVSLVRSSGTGGNCSRRRSGSIWNWITWISTSCLIVLSGRTAPFLHSPSSTLPSTYLRKLAAVSGACAPSTTISMVPLPVSKTTIVGDGASPFGTGGCSAAATSSTMSVHGIMRPSYSTSRDRDCSCSRTHDAVLRDAAHRCSRRADQQESRRKGSTKPKRSPLTLYLLFFHTLQLPDCCTSERSAATTRAAAVTGALRRARRLRVEQHPRRAEPIPEHREAVREEGLLHLHEDLAAVAEQRVESFGLRDAADGQRQVGAAHRLEAIGWNVGAEQFGAAERHAGMEDRMLPALGHLLRVRLLPMPHQHRD